jgi:hypothetical protein
VDRRYVDVAKDSSGVKRSRSSVLRTVRTLAAATIAGLCTMAIASPSSGATKPPAPVQFVSLTGEGAWSVFGELVNWQNELATAPTYVNMNYIETGSGLARQDLALGQSDYAISGVPFQPSELGLIKGGASGLIDAPIIPATMAALVEPTFDRPVAAFVLLQQVCDPNDPTTWPPDVTNGQECILHKTLTGPVKIPNRNLAAMFLHYQGTDLLPLFAWNHPDILTALGLNPDTDEIQTDLEQAGPGYAGRADPDEINYYMQYFVKEGAPDVWAGKIASDNRIQWEPIAEKVPVVVGVSRDGAEQQTEQLANGGCGVTGKCSAFVTGGVAPAPPAMLNNLRQAFPNQAFTDADVQNANGDWVEATSASITKAIAAGGDSPLYALTHKVPGAYPVSWVDHLYAPAHGLSIEKTEGIAMMIRYLVTTGQDKADAAGDGRLSPPLVSRALAAADALVKSNCVGSDRVIVKSSDPGPLTPPTATAMKSIGTMLHCEPASSVTTTTTTTTTTPSSPALPPAGQSFGGGTNTGVDSSGSTNPAGGTSATSTTTPASSSTGTTSSNEALPPVVVKVHHAEVDTASKLPFPEPAGASGTDRLATFLLGAALFLLLRKPISRVIRRGAA